MFNLSEEASVSSTSMVASLLATRGVRGIAEWKKIIFPVSSSGPNFWI